MFPAPIVCVGMWRTEGVLCADVGLNWIVPVWVSPPEEEYAILKLKVPPVDWVWILMMQFPRCSIVGTAKESIE